MKFNKDSNIAVHSLFISALFICSFYSKDSSNKQNTFSYQNFSHISEKYIQVLLV